MESYYCKTCKHNVQEKHLWKGKCPTCGQVPRAPTQLKPRVKKRFDVLVVFTDRVTGKENTVVYTDISAYRLHMLKEEATNVISVHATEREV